MKGKKKKPQATSVASSTQGQGNVILLYFFEKKSMYRETLGRLCKVDRATSIHIQDLLRGDGYHWNRRNFNRRASQKALQLQKCCLSSILPSEFCEQ